MHACSRHDANARGPVFLKGSSGVGFHQHVCFFPFAHPAFNSLGINPVRNPYPNTIKIQNWKEKKALFCYRDSVSSGNKQKTLNCLNQDVSFSTFLFADRQCLDCEYAVGCKGSFFFPPLSLNTLKPHWVYSFFALFHAPWCTSGPHGKDAWVLQPEPWSGL